MDLLKGIASKVVAAALALAVVGGAISWYQMPAEARDRILSQTGHALGWLGMVLAVPWAIIPVIGWVGRFNSNRASAVLIFVLTLVEAVALGWLLGWSIAAAAGWICFFAAVLIAAVYNLLVCDWLSEKTG